MPMNRNQIRVFIRLHSKVFWRDEGEDDEKIGIIKSARVDETSDDRTILLIDWQEDAPDKPHTLAEVIAHWPDSVSLRADGTAYWLTEMNGDRASWAHEAIKTFADQCRSHNEDEETLVSDLVADLMHYCEQNGIEWDGVLARATNHFREECSVPE